MCPWRTPYRNRDGLKAVQIQHHRPHQLPPSCTNTPDTPELRFAGPQPIREHPSSRRGSRQPSSTMITDSELYRLAIVLGSAAMILIILYHFFEVNADENEREAVNEKAQAKTTTTKTR